MIPSSGPISFSELRDEFGGSNPVSLSQYYSGGSIVQMRDSTIPLTGQISLSNFRGNKKVPDFMFNAVGYASCLNATTVKHTNQANYPLVDSDSVMRYNPEYHGLAIWPSDRGDNSFDNWMGVIFTPTVNKIRILTKADDYLTLYLNGKKVQESVSWNSWYTVEVDVVPNVPICLSANCADAGVYKNFVCRISDLNDNLIEKSGPHWRSFTANRDEKFTPAKFAHVRAASEWTSSPWAIAQGYDPALHGLPITPKLTTGHFNGWLGTSVWSSSGVLNFKMLADEYAVIYINGVFVRDVRFNDGLDTFSIPVTPNTECKICIFLENHIGGGALACSIDTGSYTIQTGPGWWCDDSISAASTFPFVIQQSQCSSGRGFTPQHGIDPIWPLGGATGSEGWVGVDFFPSRSNAYLTYFVDDSVEVYVNKVLISNFNAVSGGWKQALISLDANARNNISFKVKDPGFVSRALFARLSVSTDFTDSSVNNNLLDTNVEWYSRVDVVGTPDTGTWAFTPTSNISDFGTEGNPLQIPFGNVIWPAGSPETGQGWVGIDFWSAQSVGYLKAFCDDTSEIYINGVKIGNAGMEITDHTVNLIPNAYNNVSVYVDDIPGGGRYLSLAILKNTHSNNLSDTVETDYLVYTHPGWKSTPV